MERLEGHKQWFARLVTASARVSPTEEKIIEAFASTPRERPLTPKQGVGFMLLVPRTNTDRFAAKFVCGTMFTPCVGARDDETAERLPHSRAEVSELCAHCTVTRRRTRPAGSRVADGGCRRRE